MGEGKNWIIRGEITEDKRRALFAYSPLLRKLLSSRGIARVEEAEVFLNPDWARDNHDPFLTKNMEEAVERILRAIKNGEKILIFGDYDADGIPGVALLYSLFGRIGYNNVEIYIPDRYTESYGLAKKSIREFASREVKVMITVDCGITDIYEAGVAKSCGIDLIITDHHLLHNVLPDAYAIINHKRPDDTYPFKHLSGAGTILKLTQAIIAVLNLPKEYEYELLDLATISTVCDMVPLVGENRALVHEGLQVLASSRRAGVQALCRTAGIKQKYITENDIAFVFGPRINISSRMSRGIDAFHLLTTKDTMLANTLAKQLEERNLERRKTVDVILEAVGEQITEEDMPDMITAGSPDWRIGVLGLTANRLLEKYNRPICLWTHHQNGFVKGSCRTSGEVLVTDLFEMAGGSDFFDDYGGHTNSGGFSLSLEKAGELNVRLQEAYRKLAKKNTDKDIIVVDQKLELKEISWALYIELRRLAPFGKGNQNPIFMFENIKVNKEREFANGQAHVEFKLSKDNGPQVSVVAFFPPLDILSQFLSAPAIDILANIEVDFWRGSPELRLRLVDLRKSNE